jgi:hypothetical protein
LQDDDDYEILDEDDEDEDEDEEDEDEDDGQQNHKANLAAFYNVRKVPNQNSRLWATQQLNWTTFSCCLRRRISMTYLMIKKMNMMKTQRRTRTRWQNPRWPKLNLWVASLGTLAYETDLKPNLAFVQGVKRSAPVDGSADVEGTEDGPSDAKKTKVDWKGIGLTREMKENKTLYGHQLKSRAVRWQPVQHDANRIGTKHAQTLKNESVPSASKFAHVPIFIEHSSQ